MRQGASEVWLWTSTLPQLPGTRNAVKHGFGDIHVEQSDPFKAISPEFKLT